MSEYQYYEFSAIDAPLTAGQQAELRACSTRAQITATSFCNEYHWGDLKADRRDWMARHFDAHVYSSSWGSCDFMLSLPQEVMAPSSVARYAGGGGLGKCGYLAAAGHGRRVRAGGTGHRGIIGRAEEFSRGLARQLSTHGKRPAWLARLRKVGLM